MNSMDPVLPDIPVFFDENIISRSKRIISNSYIVSYYLSLKKIDIPIYYFIYHDYLLENNNFKNLIQITYDSNFRKVFTDKDMALKFKYDLESIVKVGVLKRPQKSEPTIKRVNKSVLFPLRNSYIKGPDIAKEAIELIHRERPDIRITTFGNLPFNQCPATSINEGIVSDNRLQELYKQNQILVVPSRVDGIPGPAVEAMMKGCAVICTNVTGAREVIEDGKTGIIVPIEDAIAIKEAVLEIIDRPDKIESFGKLARDNISEKFSSDTMVESFISVVEYYEKKI